VRVSASAIFLILFESRNGSRFRRVSFLHKSREGSTHTADADGSPEIVFAFASSKRTVPKRTVPSTLIPRLKDFWHCDLRETFASFGPNIRRAGMSGRFGIGSREGAKGRSLWEGQLPGEERWRAVAASRLIGIQSRCSSGLRPRLFAGAASQLSTLCN